MLRVEKLQIYTHLLVSHILSEMVYTRLHIFFITY